MLPSETVVKVRAIGAEGESLTEKTVSTRSARPNETRPLWLAQYVDLLQWSPESTRLRMISCQALVWESHRCVQGSNWNVENEESQPTSVWDRELAGGALLTAGEGRLSIKGRNNTQYRDVAEGVLSFEIAPSGDTIVFSASERDRSRNVVRWHLRVYDVRSGSRRDLDALDLSSDQNFAGIGGVRWVLGGSAVVYEKQTGTASAELWLIQLAGQSPSG